MEIKSTLTVLGSQLMMNAAFVFISDFLEGLGEEQLDEWDKKDQVQAACWYFPLFDTISVLRRLVNFTS